MSLPGCRNRPVLPTDGQRDVVPHLHVRLAQRAEESDGGLETLGILDGDYLSRVSKVCGRERASLPGPSGSRLRGHVPDALDRIRSGERVPVTLSSDDGTRFISKGTRQTPTSYLSVHATYKWKDKDELLRAVINRLNAKSVFSRNTTINRAGPQPGDLMCKADHVALVYKTYPPGVDHPQASDARVPIFPGPQVASRQLNQTEYFRADHSEVNPTVHFDYLNHRGEGNPVKQKAELIYFADAMEMQKAGFEFRLYNAAVLDNWADWNGEGDPPR